MEGKWSGSSSGFGAVAIRYPFLATLCNPISPYCLNSFSLLHATPLPRRGRAPFTQAFSRGPGPMEVPLLPHLPYSRRTQWLCLTPGSEMLSSGNSILACRDTLTLVFILLPNSGVPPQCLPQPEAARDCVCVCVPPCPANKCNAYSFVFLSVCMNESGQMPQCVCVGGGGRSENNFWEFLLIFLIFHLAEAGDFLFLLLC